MLPPRRLGSLTVAHERAAMRGHPGLQPVTSSWQSLWNIAHIGAPAPVNESRQMLQTPCRGATRGIAVLPDGRRVGEVDGCKSLAPPAEVGPKPRVLLGQLGKVGLVLSVLVGWVHLLATALHPAIPELPTLGGVLVCRKRLSVSLRI